jgi:hypothetical protein
VHTMRRSLRQNSLTRKAPMSRLSGVNENLKPYFLAILIITLESNQSQNLDSFRFKAISGIVKVLANRSRRQVIEELN